MLPHSIRRVAPIFVFALVAAAGCSTSLSDLDPITNAVLDIDVDGINFTADASAAGKTVNVTLLAKNVSGGATETTILGGNCRLMVRLYHGAQGTDEWSEYAEVDGCQEPAETISLAPEAQQTLSHSVEVDVGSGVYLATVTFQHLNTVQVRNIELVAGNVTIN